VTSESQLEAANDTSVVADPRVSPRAVGWAVLALVLAALVVVNWAGVTQPRYEDGDFAANSILIDKALDLELVHGNYSRTGFYHPGPALLYVQAASQFLFHDLFGVLPTPYNAHLLGIFLLNAAMLALSARILYRTTGSLSSIVCLVVAAFAYSLLFAGVLSTTWMPHVYIWPFLLFLISSASVATGRTQDLWAFALATGLLVHGHVSFAIPVIVFAAVLGVLWVSRYRLRWLSVIPPRERLAAVSVLLLFMLPLVLQLIVDFPGQFDDYIRYMQAVDLPPRSPRDVVRYLAQYWHFGRVTQPLLPGLVLAAFGSAFLTVSTRYRESRLALLGAGVLGSATTAAYAFTGIDDLSFTYLALFYIGVPILYWTLLASAVFDRWAGGRPALSALMAVSGGIALIVILIQPGSATPYKGSDVGVAYRSINQALAPGVPVALSLGAHADWPAVVGILEQARRDGRPACVRVWPGIFEILFTSENVCSEGPGEGAEALVTSSAGPPLAEAEIIFDGDNYDIWRLDRGK
jgi:hypothetical protein